MAATSSSSRAPQFAPGSSSPNGSSVHSPSAARPSLSLPTSNQSLTTTAKIIDTLLQNIAPVTASTTNAQPPPIHLDLVLDGGAFNGSYMLGVLLMLKEMERRGRVHVGRISGASVGALCAALYHYDALDRFDEFHDLLVQQLQTHRNFDIAAKVRGLLREIFRGDGANAAAVVPWRKLYVTYWDFRSGCSPRKVTRSSYRDVDDLVDVLLRSSHIPGLMSLDDGWLYRGRYMDGICPWFFRGSRRHILFVNLSGIDKISQVLCIHNERTNYGRVLGGILDLHNFFLGGNGDGKHPTRFCSYIGTWGATEWANWLAAIVAQWIIVLVVGWLRWLGGFIWGRSMRHRPVLAEYCGVLVAQLCL